MKKQHKFRLFIKQEGAILWHSMNINLFELPPSQLGKQDDFEKCKDTIVSETKNGWRLKQVVVPYQEKSRAYFAKGYEIILEKEIIHSTI